MESLSLVNSNCSEISNNLLGSAAVALPLFVCTRLLGFAFFLLMAQKFFVLRGACARKALKPVRLEPAYEVLAPAGSRGVVLQRLGDAQLHRSAAVDLRRCRRVS
jgi:hypothetical protein